MTFCVLRDLVLAGGSVINIGLSSVLVALKFAERLEYKHTQFVWIQMFTAGEVIEKHL